MEVDVKCSQADGKFESPSDVIQMESFVAGLFVSRHQVCGRQVSTSAPVNDMQRLRLKLRPECVDDSLLPLVHSEVSQQTKVSAQANYGRNHRHHWRDNGGDDGGVLQSPSQEHIDTATNATIVVSLLITLFCFWRPHAVNALLLPVGTFEHVQLRSREEQYRHYPRREERVPGVTFAYLLITTLTLIYQMLSPIYIFNAVFMAAVLVYILICRPTCGLLVQMYNLWVFLLIPVCVILASKGVIQWKVMQYGPMLFGTVLHDLPSQQLRAAIFVNAIHLYTGESFLLSGCIFATLLSTFAVMIKAHLHASLSRWMSEWQFAACLTAVGLVLLALCRLQDAYSSQIHSALQEHASISKAFACSIALLLALVCYIQEQVVDTLLLPAGAIALDRIDRQAQHERVAEIGRIYGICMFSLAIGYQVSYGMWFFSTCSMLNLLWLLDSNPSYSKLLRLYNLWQFCGSPIAMGLVYHGFLCGRGWANCFIISTLGAVLQDSPSQQIRSSLFHAALLVLKGDMTQVVGSGVLCFVSTLLSIRAKTTLLQRELYDKLEQAKLKEVCTERPHPFGQLNSLSCLVVRILACSA